MSRSTSFDWYQLSKIEEEKLDIENFANLIKQTHFGQQLKRVPSSLRQKLLIVFQKASFDIKDKYQSENQMLHELTFKKKIVAEQIKVMKHDLEYSVQKINGDKVLIEEKKRIIQKIKQKIKKKQQKKLKQRANTERGAQVYFCPFCTREDFTSRDQFTFHMFKEHSKSFNDIAHPSNESNQGSITADVKDLILSLKDKQIQLMQMMLNKKKQMQTMELEYAYSQEIKKIRSQANFNDRKSQYLTNYDKKTKKQQESEQQEQLKGQSQYLFYQKSQRTNQPVHRHQNEYHPDSKIDNSFYEQSEQYIQPRANNQYGRKYQQHQLTERQIRKHFPQHKQNDYYNIFNSEVAVQQVNSLLSPQKSNQIPQVKPSVTVFGDQTLGPHQSPSMPIIGRLNFNPENPNTNKNLSWNQPIQKSIQPLQPMQNPVQSKIYNYTQNIQIGRPTQRSQIETSDRKYETVYRSSKQNISQLDDGHIFNSGPLMDDDGDGSEYEDYFGQRQHDQSKDEVIDEQIKIIKPKQNIVPHIKFNANFNRNPNPQMNSNSSSAKPQQNLSISNSMSHANNQSNLILQYSKDKSFLDVSHSKQKSSDLIDLSNSFSKRGLESSNNQDQTINLSDLKLSKLQKERQQLKQQIRLAQHQMQLQRNMENHSIVQQTSSLSQQSKYKSNPRILQQFKRQQQIQIKYERIVSRTQKPPSTTKIKLPQNIELLKTKPGVLDEFFVKSLQNQRE